MLMLVSLTYGQQGCSDIYPQALCQGITGNRFVSSFRSCQNWLQCIGGNVANCGMCTGYLHFDPDTQTCTYPENANCDIYAANVTCTVGQVSREPHPTNCQLYFLCTGAETPVQQSCADNLHFDPALRACNFPELANCQPGGPPTGPPGVQCPDVDGISLIPDPTSCDNFYICDFNRHPTRYTCPVNHHFCTAFRFCRPIGQAICVQPSSPFQVLETLSDFECPPTGVHFFRRSGDCSQYIMCIDGSAYPQSCAPGLYFNPNSQRCEQSQYVLCPY
ncbi:hypothetical protein DMENIID0001_144280 [Sergentomyia squamirostris]